ncbi:unnamed protein product, partial [Citrullus colocynthis]
VIEVEHHVKYLGLLVKLHKGKHKTFAFVKDQIWQHDEVTYVANLINENVGWDVDWINEFCHLNDVEL